MKKITVLTLAMAAALSLTACGQKDARPETAGGEKTVQSETIDGEKTAQSETAGEKKNAQSEESEGTDSGIPESVTVTTLNGNGEKVELEVPYNPERIAILDMAVLDMMDHWDLGNRVVGMPKSSKIDYLMEYNNNDDIVNLGTLKEVDMEALMASEPDVIFIGGRLSAQYDQLSKIAPVIYTAVDYEEGVIQSVKNNAAMIASIFGQEERAADDLAGFDARVEALRQAAEGKTAVIGMVTSSNLSTLGDGSRCSLIGNEAGFTNLANDVDSTHGNESSFELLVSLNPDYIFVLDRDSAINTEGARLAEEVMDNELVKKTDAYKNDRIVYLTPTVWYLAEGGITATDVMLSDLEAGILGLE